MHRIEAPAVKPEKGGLLSVITPRTDVEAFAFSYGVTFESVLAGKPQLIPEADTDKESGSVSKVSFEPFTVYSMIKASIVDDADFAQQRLKDAFEGGLSHAVEAAMKTTVLSEAVQLGSPGPNPSSITNPRLALGMLEQWGSENLGTQLLIHTNKMGASMLRDLKVDDQYRLTTKQGNLVANGGGYGQDGPARAPAGIDEAWIYVSRVPDIYRTATEYTTAHDLKKNEFYALAEARFIPVLEGGVAAVRLKG